MTTKPDTPPLQSPTPPACSPQPLIPLNQPDPANGWQKYLASIAPQPIK